MSEKIIISPLDWGLGHAARCIPIIRSYLEQNAEVEIASAITHKNFFAQEFPGLAWHEAPAYDIKYPKHGWQMPFWIFGQIPRIKKTMLEENKWLASLCEKQKYTQIISDNRFGFFNKKTKSIYITHQLRIAFPTPFTLFEKSGERWHKGIMKNFDEIWVPDYEKFPGLAGKLSHPSYADKRIKYIGPLSRLDLRDMEHGAGDAEKSIDILALISGPEPQRAIFEKYAIKFLAEKTGEHCMVRGLPDETEIPALPFETFNHLPAADLREKILASRAVLCRSGYSTLMDLDLLKANAILVPTPGQTEQIYLAKLWRKRCV
jgi:predicted glycosyltransferase